MDRTDTIMANAALVNRLMSDIVDRKKLFSKNGDTDQIVMAAWAGGTAMHIADRFGFKKQIEWLEEEYHNLMKLLRDSRKR